MASACTVRLGRAQRCPVRCVAGVRHHHLRCDTCRGLPRPLPPCPACDGVGMVRVVTGDCNLCGRASVLHDTGGNND